MRAAETRSWLAKAAIDLRAAEHEFDAVPPILEDIVFHCQQAAEKSLKGFLSWHDIPFRKTHDLVELGRQCARHDPSLEPLLRRVAPLTEYAWRFRYPGEPDSPSREEADDAFAVAREAFEAICGRLPAEARP